jgi:TPR repeat protein
MRTGGAEFRTGLGGERITRNQARKLAQQACDGKDTDACVLLAAIYQSGETIEPDLAERGAAF